MDTHLPCACCHLHIMMHAIVSMSRDKGAACFRTLLAQLHAFTCLIAHVQFCSLLDSRALLLLCLNVAG